LWRVVARPGAQPAVRMNVDRRAAPRIPCEVFVELYYDGLRLPCDLVNLNMDGALVRTPMAIRAGEEVAIVMSATPGGDSASIRCVARVIRASTEGLGLAFRESDLESVRALKDLLLIPSRRSNV